MTPFGDGVLYTGDYVEAAGFGLRFGNTGQRSAIDGIVSADRDDDGAGTQKFSYNRAQKVATKEAELFFFGSKKERTIAVAIGRDYGIKRPATFSNKILNDTKLGLINGFSINRYKSITAASRGNFGAKPLENTNQKVTADSEVLVGQSFMPLSILPQKKLRQRQIYAVLPSAAVGRRLDCAL